MTGRQDDRQDDRQRILDEYMIDENTTNVLRFKNNDYMARYGTKNLLWKSEASVHCDRIQCYILLSKILFVNNIPGFVYNITKTRITRGASTELLYPQRRNTD